VNLDFKSSPLGGEEEAHLPRLNTLAKVVKATDQHEGKEIPQYMEALQCVEAALSLYESNSLPFISEHIDFN
jgi:hypothetical protein